MKKVLFGTTALVGAALIASVAQAEGPKVTVGGFYDFAAAWTNDKTSVSGIDTQRGYTFRNDTEVSFKIDGVASSGLKYGAEISLEADVDTAGGSSSGSPYSANNQGLHSSVTYGYLEGSWGRVEMGSNVGADQTLKVDGTSISRATGGIGGASTFFWNVPASATSTNSGVSFITSPDLIVNHGLTAGGDQTYQNISKVTYYTPRWNGLQAGVSYAPDLGDRGQDVSRSIADDEFNNVWQGGINYDNTFSGVGVALSATGEAAQTDRGNSAEDIRAYALGAKFSYMGFALAGSWGDWTDSDQSNNDDAEFWNVALAYENGAYGASVGYLSSKIDPTGAGNDNKFRNISVGADYKLAPGITPYVEANFYKFDGPGTGTADNSSSLVIVGSQLAF